MSLNIVFFKSDDGVCLCKSTGTVDQRYNKKKLAPNLIDNNNPSVGLTNINVKLENGWLKCSFKRTKKNIDVANYFDLNSNYYILAAYGIYDASSGKNKQFYI